MFKENHFEELLKQTKNVQEQIKKANQNIANIKVVGTSAAGLVKITVDGKYNCVKVDMNKDLCKEDLPVIEGIIAAAFNNAVQRLERIKSQTIQELSSNVSFYNE